MLPWIYGFRWQQSSNWSWLNNISSRIVAPTTCTSGNCVKINSPLCMFIFSELSFVFLSSICVSYTCNSFWWIPSKGSKKGNVQTCISPVPNVLSEIMNLHPWEIYKKKPSGHQWFCLDFFFPNMPVILIKAITAPCRLYLAGCRRPLTATITLLLALCSSLSGVLHNSQKFSRTMGMLS